MKNNSNEFRRKYDELFPTEEIKAKAFDKIAENYYFGNFGTMQKSDIDVLLFSIYLEEILNKTEDDMNTYSDYTLAKRLGISQSRISNLKVKKQLKYPYERFDWKKSFLRLCKNAQYEHGKISINLRDRNLYYELRNQLDESGSYAETTLTANLLVITPTNFIDLTKQIMTNEELSELKKAIKNKYAQDKKFCEKLEEESLGDTIKDKFKDNMVSIVCDTITNIAPPLVGTGINILNETFQRVLKKEKSNNK